VLRPQPFVDDPFVQRVLVDDQQAVRALEQQVEVQHLQVAAG
jgi:hypothetical protein